MGLFGKVSGAVNRAMDSRRQPKIDNTGGYARSKSGYNQTMGPQVQGNWSTPSSDWKETNAEKQSHNWGPGF